MRIRNAADEVRLVIPNDIVVYIIKILFHQRDWQSAIAFFLTDKNAYSIFRSNDKLINFPVAIQTAPADKAAPIFEIDFNLIKWTLKANYFAYHTHSKTIANYLSSRNIAAGNAGLLSHENIVLLKSRLAELDQLIQTRRSSSQQIAHVITMAALTIPMVYVYSNHNALKCMIESGEIQQCTLNLLVYCISCLTIAPGIFSLKEFLSMLNIYPILELQEEKNLLTRQMNRVMNERFRVLGKGQIDLESSKAAGKLKDFPGNLNAASSNTLSTCKRKTPPVDSPRFFSRGNNMAVSAAHMTDEAMSAFYSKLNYSQTLRK